MEGTQSDKWEGREWVKDRIPACRTAGRDAVGSVQRAQTLKARVAILLARLRERYGLRPAMAQAAIRYDGELSVAG